MFKKYDNARLLLITIQNNLWKPRYKFSSIITKKNVNISKKIIKIDKNCILIFKQFCFSDNVVCNLPIIIF